MSRYYAYNAPPPLCGHGVTLKYRNYKAECPVCKSFWDLDALKADIIYDSSYPRLRSHFDTAIGINKVNTLKDWLKINKIDISSQIVCEIGFGGGFCLKYLQDISKGVFGIEVVAENIENAVRCGVKRESLYLTYSLPSELSTQVDLWLFQDSFEHLPNPDHFIEWLVRNSSEYAHILIVSPEAGSISERLFKRFWPHKLHDHVFHWSKKGVIDFMWKKGFRIVRFFKPLKYVSFKTIINHFIFKTGAPKGLFDWFDHAPLINLHLHFNIGEMGLLFKKER
jgi:hypothetical protein